MADQLYFSRDSKCFIEFKGVVWEIPVLDGFSFSQANNTSEITLSEMESTGGLSRRGRRAFNDSLSAGEWSFSTYVRPFKAAGAAVGTGSADADDFTHSVEEVLWSMMAGADTYDKDRSDFENTTVINATDMVQGETYEIVSTGNTNFTATNVATFEAGVTPANTVGLVITAGSVAATGTGTVKRKVTSHVASESRISFHASNTSTLQPANIYFVLGEASRTVIKLKDAVVNEASIDFEIDGIATINWSGQCSEVLDFTGSTIESDSEPNNGDDTQDATDLAIGDVWLQSNSTPKTHRLFVCTDNADGGEAFTTYVNEAITDSDNFIRNRLTSLTIDGTSQSGLQNSYSLTLTGGNITISNNISYITPEELGVVNVPIGHVTGARSVSGSFTCYLTRDGSTFNSTRSRDFFEDLRGLTSVVTNNVGLTFNVGGTAAGTRRLEIDFGSAHVEIPTHSIEDVISLETNFQALPSSIDGTNEMTLKYKV